MKFLSIVLIIVSLFVSCSTVSEGDNKEELGIDDVKETEMTQEEFEGIFGKKEYYTSIDREDVEMTDLDPVVMEDKEIWEEPVVVEEDVSLDIPLIEEPEIFVPESDFFFPGVTEEIEWVDVPEIEVLEETEVIEQEEDISLPTPSDATELIVLYQSEEKSAEDESLLSDYESALEERESVIEEESESLEAVSIEAEDDSFITIEEVLSGEEKVEPRRRSILMLLASKPLLSAIILAVVAFGSIGYIIMRIETKGSFRDVDYDDSTVTEEDEESEEVPHSPSPDIIGVPVNNEEKMDIREGEESYSALVEESLS